MGDEAVHNDISYAFSIGQPGNRFTALAAESVSPLAAVRVPDEAAQCWQITLLAMQLGNEPINPASGAAIQNFQQRQKCLTGFNSAPFKVRVEYGTGNTQEVARIDYPFSGSTFEVRAAFVRVFMDQQPAAFAATPVTKTLPQVGAFISPGNSRSKSKFVPTFTTAVVAVPVIAPGLTLFAAPERAIGYRVWTPDQSVSTATNGIGIQETDYQGNIITWDAESVIAKRAPNGWVDQSDWAWLHPSATCIAIVNEGDGPHNYGVTWVLDLG